MSAPAVKRYLLLKGGLFDGRWIERPTGCHTIVMPSVEAGGRISSHSYSVPEGRWLHSETYVGYKSDETIERERAFDEWMYWDWLEHRAEESFT